MLREWVTLPVASRALGFDFRTLRKYIEGEDFVRVIGDRWYVRYARLIEWFEHQPRSTREATRKGGR